MSEETKNVHEMNVEDWKKIGVTWNDNGSAVISLSREIKVGAMTVQAVTMQCPSLNQAEEIDAQPQKGETSLAKEKRHTADLMGLAPEEMGQIAFPDYRRVQKVYGVFLNGTPPLFIGGASDPQSASSPGGGTSR